MSAVSVLIGLLPYNLIYPISLFCGKLLYFIFKDRTKIALYNLNKILPEISFNKKKALIIKSYANLIANILELIKIQNFSKEQLKKIFFVHNTEELDKLLSQGKGCILVTGHFGNWELSVVLPLFLNKEILTVGKKQRPDFFNKFLFKIRTNFGMKVIESKNAIISLFKTLKRKKIVGLIIDQRTRKENSVEIDFFGEKIYCSSTPVFLALKTGAPIIGCYAKRDKDGSHHFYFTEEIKINRAGDFEKLLAEGTQVVHDKITEIILKNPDNWFWLHSKFKSKRRTLLEIN